MLQPRAFPVSYEYVGQTAGSKEVEVRARVTGILEKRLFAEGAAVKAGQPLFVIDPKPLEAQAAALSSLFTSPATAWRFGSRAAPAAARVESDRGQCRSGCRPP